MVSLNSQINQPTVLEKLISHIKSYHPISAEAQAAVERCFEQVILSQGEYLLTEGKICRHLYFLESGAVRGYYNLEGKEITHWFGFESDFVTSFYSFTTGQPA